MALFGNVSKNVKGAMNFQDQCTFQQGASGMGIQVVKGSTIWYVDKNTGLTASGGGKSWATAFLTVTEALAAAGDYDVILIGQGIYDESTFPLTIDQTGLKIFGASSSGYNWGPCAMKSSSSGETIFQIDANGVEIAGVDFNLYTSGKSGIVVGFSKSVYKTHIHDCFFGCSGAGGGEGECGVAIGVDETGAASFDAVDTHVERCGFHYLAIGGVVAYGTRTKINQCIFLVTDAGGGAGISFLATGVNRVYHMAFDNYIIGRAGSALGIRIASTEPTAGTLLVANNIITNCGGGNITTGKSIAGIVNNQTYADAATYKQVDTTP